MAITLNPNDALAHGFLGRAFFFSGQPDKSIPLLKKAMRLNPHYPWVIPYVLGRVYYHSRRYDDAKAIFEKVLHMCLEGSCSPKWPHMQLAQICSELGRIEEARFHMQTVLEHDPKFNFESRRKQNMYKNLAMNEREIAALSKAGAPEHPPSQ
jgi:tetratricopeptide (TPR) repeat protein